MSLLRAVAPGVSGSRAGRKSPRKPLSMQPAVKEQS
jgi:hypothetical protein